MYREQQEQEHQPAILLTKTGPNSSGRYATVYLFLPSRPMMIFTPDAYRRLSHLMQQAYIMCLKYRARTPHTRQRLWEYAVLDDRAYFRGIPRQHAYTFADAMLQAAYADGGVMTAGKHWSGIVAQYDAISEEVKAHYWEAEDGSGERCLLPKYHAQAPIPTDEHWLFDLDFQSSQEQEQ